MSHAVAGALSARASDCANAGVLNKTNPSNSPDRTAFIVSP
jgi:hypothetical protein